MCSEKTDSRPDVRLTYEVDPDESITNAIVTSVSTVTGRPPIGGRACGVPRPDGLPPLYDAVDPEPLEALLSSQESEPRDGDLVVTFAYQGHEVTVRSQGVVSVAPLRDGEDASGSSGRG